MLRRYRTKSFLIPRALFQAFTQIHFGSTPQFFNWYTCSAVQNESSYHYSVQAPLFHSRNSHLTQRTSKTSRDEDQPAMRRKNKAIKLLRSNSLKSQIKPSGRQKNHNYRNEPLDIQKNNEINDNMQQLQLHESKTPFQISTNCRDQLREWAHQTRKNNGIFK